MSRFFQPFILEHQHARLDIPVAFTPNLGGLRDTARVRRCKTNMTWDVRINMATDRHGQVRFQMTGGWARVVADNNVQRGDFLVFQYYGNSVSGLTVYTPTGCEREIQHFGPSLEVPLLVRTPTWIMDNDETSMAAACFANNSYLPSFIVKMNEIYLRTGAVNIPLNFGREHIRTTRDAPAVLHHNGNDYDVIIRTYRNEKGVPYVCKIKSGFVQFSNAASLTTSDVCTFKKLPGDGQPTFHVTVFNNN